MKSKAVFYHDGCNLCLGMAAIFGTALNPGLYDTEVVDLSRFPERMEEAGKAGVKVLPSLCMSGQVFAINAHSDLYAQHC
ncbi:MAG TPA: hypothetical protein VEC35_12565 [Noviherbaspirillum sp.]|nr:hypothetical protein [Noviherbaspirillum sp.]